jgi:heme exporter protein A
MIAISARRLKKTFGNRVVLGELDLDVAEGQSVALVGANGAGKTTLLRLLASLVRPSSGEVRWFGRPAGTDPAQRRLVGMVAHENLLYPDLTLWENLVFAARMCALARPNRTADRWLRDTGLEYHARRRPTQISRGMRQRLGLARALLHDPRIVLLDEPFGGLDREGTDWLTGLLLGLRSQGTTLCFAAHDENNVRRLADRVLHLESGRLQEVGTGTQQSAVSDQPSAMGNRQSATGRDLRAA